jgi:hypothetical protein
MKIGLYNLQPKYKNLALEKIRKYYLDCHDVVEDCYPISASNYDMVYCSSIFEWTSQKYVTPNMIKGGTGFDLNTKLPPEIDAVEPHLNFGFTSRGCIRHCKFCVVPQKEGAIRVESDLFSLWDGRAKKITLYDNNILALPEHFQMICNQALEHKIKLDFNQGLDHRLLTPDIVDLLAKISHEEYHFAFDNPNNINQVGDSIDLLQESGIKRSNWYVLVGFDTTFEQDLFRLNYLRERGQNAYVQRYQSKTKKLGREYIKLAEWANQHHIFYGMTWEQFLKHPKNKNYIVLVDSK